MIRVPVTILHQHDYLTAWFSALKSQEVEKYHFNVIMERYGFQTLMFLTFFMIKEPFALH